MTNIGLYGCNAKTIAELKKKGVIPCIHKSWNKTMADIGNEFWTRIDLYVLRLRESKETDRTAAERQLITAMDNTEQDERTRPDQKKNRSENSSDGATNRRVTVIQSIFRMRSQRVSYLKHQTALARIRSMVRSRIFPRSKADKHTDGTSEGYDGVTNPGKDMVGGNPAR